jgi:hypothetical protein
MLPISSLQTFDGTELGAATIVGNANEVAPLTHARLPMAQVVDSIFAISRRGQDNKDERFEAHHLGWVRPS